MSYFVNYSNHPSSAWSSDQIAAAHKYGDIIDIPFPNVSASSGEEEILQTAKDGVERIMRYNPAAVLVQGEFTLTGVLLFIRAALESKRLTRTQEA